MRTVSPNLHISDSAVPDGGGSGSDMLADGHNALPDMQIGSIVVEPVYPLHPDWNDYVKNDNGETNRFDQADQACTGDEPGRYDSCIHAGELRRVALPELDSCDGLAASDALDAFRWICRVRNASAVFLSTGLRPEVGLAHLVDAGGFRPNRVSVTKDGQPVARSDERVWWANPVLPLPQNAGASDGVAVLDRPGAVYVLPGSRHTQGYNINADRIAIVTLPGAVLELRANAVPSCNMYTGEAAAPAPPDDQNPLLWRPATVCAGDQRFLWLEGEYHNPPTDVPVDDFNTGVVLLQSNRCAIRRLWTQDGGYGLLLYSSDANLAYDIHAMNHSKYGVIIGAGWQAGVAHNNVVSRYFATNAGTGNGYTAILVGSGASDNIFTQMVVAHSYPWGVFQYASGNDNNIYSHITATSCSRGIALEGSDNSVLVQTITANHAENGVVLNNATNTRIAHLVAVHNGEAGIRRELNTAGSAFEGSLLFGDNAAGNCPGCDLSAASVRTGVDLTQSFVGPVTSDAPNAASATRLAHAAIDDWLHFENEYRGWGTDAASFPHPQATGRCAEWQTCRIWDWRLVAQDDYVVNRSGDGSASNDPFVAGQSCPAAAHGDLAISDAAGTVTFLINAVELFFDAVGNDNGLCESDEACVYSPHFGAYQGEGPISAETCEFADGAVSGVALHARANLTP